ncbi:MAG: hypothetical protein IPO75_17895 [Betaproteobacteria bacterium]|nr:hypothetical protein [Betaproteobacteria bacterium]
MTRFPTIACALALAALVAACASSPPVPDWQGNARSAMDRAIAAYLSGDSAVADVEFRRARAEIARTGRTDLLARVELMRCAARVASLVFERCEGFERLAPDAEAAERAYADYLAARVAPADIALLPPPHRAVAAASVGADAAVEAVKGIEEPLSKLVAIGVLFQAGRASPPAIALAADTASSQGWRRPLLAWLSVQLALAEKAGNAQEAERLRRRVGVVQDSR